MSNAAISDEGKYIPQPASSQTPDSFYQGSVGAQIIEFLILNVFFYFVFKSCEQNKARSLDDKHNPRVVELVCK